MEIFAKLEVMIVHCNHLSDQAILGFDLMGNNGALT